MIVAGIEPVRRLRINEIEPLGAPLPLAAVPPGISGASSLAASTPIDKIYDALRRPFLPLPHPYYMTEILRVEREMNRLIKIEGALLDKEIRSDLDRIEELNRKKIELLRQRAHELESKAKWSAWQTVTQYVASATSIVTGFGCLATGAGTTAGMFLIASGGLGLVNRIGADVGAWEFITGYFTETRQAQIRLAERVEFGFSALSVGLAITGSIGAYHARAIELLSLSRDQILQAATALGLLNTVTQGTLRARESFSNARALCVGADVKKLTAESHILKEQVSTQTEIVRKMIQLSDEIDRIAKQAISSLTL